MLLMRCLHIRKDLGVHLQSIQDQPSFEVEFLGEDKVIVESVHKSYLENFKLGPPNRLEQRIIHWQNIYKEFLNASGISL